MNASRLTTVRIAQIRAALMRVKDSREHSRQATADPSGDSLQREFAKDCFTAAIREFGWQYTNIEAVLDELAPEK